MTEERTEKEHESGYKAGDVVKLNLNGVRATDTICGFSRATLFDRRKKSSEIAIMKEYGFVPIEQLSGKA